MSSADIPMCTYHLDRRGFSHEGWKVPTKDEPCHQCSTGLMPDWELPADFVPYNQRSLEDHVARMLAQQYPATPTS